MKESPILKVQLAPRRVRPRAIRLTARRAVGFADVSVVVMPDGSSLGQGTYEVPGSGSFLSFELPLAARCSGRPSIRTR